MHTQTAATTPVASVSLPHVRLATPDDLDEILELGRELHQENGLTGLNETAIRQAAIAAINGKDGLIGVIGKKTIEGMIFLGLRQYWYSNDVHLEEMLSYVRPDYRKSRNAIALIEFAKLAAERVSLPLLIGIVSNKKTEQKIKLYQRRLGKPAGAYFLWNAKTGR